MPSPTSQQYTEQDVRTPSTELFRSCATGSCERDWSEFVDRFHPRLKSAVRRALLRLEHPGAVEERVEDLVQEIYCRLLEGGRRCRQFRGESEGQLMAYLQRVAASVVIDDRRLAQAEKRWGGLRVTIEDWTSARPLASASGTGPEVRLLVREQRRLFLSLCRRALGLRASPVALEIARLALLDGWTSREIAARLGGRMGIAGVDSVICRLRRKLASRGVALPRRDTRPPMER